MARKNNMNSLVNDEQSALLETHGIDRQPDRQPCVRQRYIMAAALVFGFGIAYCARTNISVAIVAIVNQTYVKDHGTKHNASVYDACPELDRSNSTSKYEEGEFKWMPATQGIILGSFYYGYIFTNLLGGFLADRYGAKHVVGLSILASCLVSVLTPVTARFNLYVFIFIRVLQGMCQGLIFPAATGMMAAWAPKHERAMMNTMPTVGVYLGIMVSFPVTGILCETDIAGGWPSAFYIFGILALVWYPFWIYFASSSPQSHPRITKQERDYIQFNVQTIKTVQVPVPWFKLLTSIHVIAIVVAIAGDSFTYGAILSFLPTYMEQILKFNMYAAGILSILPYIASLIASIIGGYMGDYLAVKLKSVTASRRIMTVFSHLICAVVNALIPIAGCNRIAAVSLFVTNAFIGCLVSGGAGVNAIDLAPQYAGIITGLTNTFASVSMILGPLATGAIINKAQTITAWGTAFYVMSGLMAASGIFYIIFASGELQPWAVVKRDEVINDDSSGDTDSNEK